MHAHIVVIFFLDVGYNRCNGDENPCSTNAQCMDSLIRNQITCTCLVGYFGDGMDCTGEERCHPNGIAHSCCALYK